MNWQSVLIGLASFVIIGLFHPVVIKAEYYFSKKIWTVFLLAGLVCVGAALCVRQYAVSAILSVLGFTCWWSIKELFEQEKRVARGQFPQNPKRKK